MHRSTLIKILTSLRNAGGYMLRNEIGNRWNHSRLDACLSREYPHGLKYLVVEERVKGPRQPLRRWVLTRLGREFLVSLEADPQALPVIPPYTQVHSAETSAARWFQAERLEQRRRKERWKLKQQYGRRGKDGRYIRSSVRSNPAYDAVLHIDSRSKEFQKLSSLQKIQALRTRCGKNRGERQ